MLQELAGHPVARSHHVGVVVDPRTPSHDVCLLLSAVEERRTILTKQHQFLVEDVLVNPADLTRRTVVGNWPLSRLSLLGVHRHALAVENVDELSERNLSPVARQLIVLVVVVHAASTSFTSRSTSASFPPNTCCARPSPPSCANGTSSKSSTVISTLVATCSRIISSHRTCSAVNRPPCCPSHTAKRAFTPSAKGTNSFSFCSANRTSDTRSVSSRCPEAPRTRLRSNTSYACHNRSGVHDSGGALIASASALMSS